MRDGNWKSYRSKEDQTKSISQSVFVTNFPDHFTARDLWKVCNDYGVIVDAFIPYTKLKPSKVHKPSAPSHHSNANERNSPGSYVSILKSGKTNNVKSDQSSDDEEAEDDGSQSEDKVTADNDIERVSASSCMHNNDLLYDNNHNNVMPGKDKVLSDDPFNLYNILNKRKDSGDTLKYPPGFTPNVINVEEVNKKVKGVTSNEVNEHVNSTSNKLEESVPKGKLSLNNSACSKRVHTGGSILQLMDDLVKGNSSFDYALSSSLGNSGGILCVWEPTLFVKDNVTSSDNLFVVMDRWDGDYVIMGDFNEVRTEQERYGSVFDVQGTNTFNSFISLASLIDIPIDGYAYTWAHKTANKMSKLDRFLVSKGLLALFLYLSALCLDRNLSDHRPILMRELCIDYGPTPFIFFHFWFNLDGFDKMVEDTWKSLASIDSNGMINLKKKLQALKIVIKQWTKNAKKSSYKAKMSIQSKLSDIDKIFNQGASNEEILSDRSLLLLEQQANLERNIFNEEIKSVVWDCGTNKTSGPDGFTFEFFCRYWKLLDHDIVEVVKEFFDSGLFSGIPIDSSLTLSHLFFVDDAIFVGKWDSLNIRTIANVLKYFHLASGMKINFHRSKIMGIGTRPEEVDTTSTTMGCSIFTTPFVHLGVKVGGAMFKIKYWDGVVTKVSYRLSKWKLKTLSIGG
ncbi:RNA-directed DNA polymerase, eukaryota [Tanacetum coccineum]